MRSTVTDTLPTKVRRALTKLGADIRTARKKRQLTVVMMCERAGIAKSTYLRVEHGDPTVSLGIYAMCLFVLGFGEALGRVIEPSTDEQGLLLEVLRLPKRVRVKKSALPL